MESKKVRTGDSLSLVLAYIFHLLPTKKKKKSFKELQVEQSLESDKANKHKGCVKWLWIKELIKLAKWVVEKPVFKVPSKSLTYEFLLHFIFIKR